MIRFALGSAQVLRTPYILGKSGIPFIGLSSGSVAAGGAISGITALPVVYPVAYCYFPANALSASSAAGWYYCTFSTTSAGVAFLNTYTSGTPTIPASPTAVTAGQGAFTGDTGEEFGPTITIPAGGLGANGNVKVECDLSCANNANVKTGRIRYSGNAGTVFQALAVTNTTGGITWGDIANRGVTNSQEGTFMSVVSTASLTSTVNTGAAVDTTAATTVVLSIQRATATDNLLIDNFLVTLISDGT